MSKTPPSRKAAPAASPRKTQETAKAAPVAKSDAVLPFTRTNYLLFIGAVLVIAFGFFLMSLDGFVDATQFSISLYVAPVVVVAGFIGIIFAIMYRTKPTTGE